MSKVNHLYAATKRLVVNAEAPEEHLIIEAADALRRRELVAFPTETVYGLGGNGLDVSSARMIYDVKGRPTDNPLILHVADEARAMTLVRETPAITRELMRLFWPGPLTLVMKKARHVPDAVSGGTDTVAVRMPDHPVALELLRAVDFPLAAPSANLSGKPSPTTADHVLEDLEGKIYAVLDGGPTRIGLESTVLDLSGERPAILRPGGIGYESLRTYLPDLINATGGASPLSPGTRYRHYSPNASLTLVFNEAQSKELAIDLTTQGLKVAWVGSHPPGGVNHVLFPPEAEFYARHFFAVLRDLDSQGIDHIFTEVIAEEGLGQAVMDRMKRAAGYTNASS